MPGESGDGPLTVVDGKKIADGKPGNVTRKLMQAYTRLVKKETR